jgi:hypothetical protein
MAVFDHGPLGFPPLAAHGHADALAVWLHVDGVPVLVGRGTEAYSGPLRGVLRGTGAHNTAVVEDADQSRQVGPFAWESWARSRTVPCGEALAAAAAAEHDGYVGRFGVTHRRRLWLRGRTMTVIDSFRGRGAPHVKLWFHLAPGFGVRGAELLRGGRVFGTVRSDLALHPIQVPHAHGYGVASQGVALLGQASLTLPAEVRTVLDFPGSRDPHDGNPDRGKSCG